MTFQSVENTRLHLPPNVQRQIAYTHSRGASDAVRWASLLISAARSLHQKASWRFLIVLCRKRGFVSQAIPTVCGESPFGPLLLPSSLL